VQLSQCSDWTTGCISRNWVTIPDKGIRFLNFQISLLLNGYQKFLPGAKPEFEAAYSLSSMPRSRILYNFHDIVL
jgi:hypothetical protein